MTAAGSEVVDGDANKAVELKGGEEQQQGGGDCMTVLGCSFFEVLRAVRALLDGAGKGVPGSRSLAMAAVEVADDHYAACGAGQGLSNVVEELLLG